MSSHNQKQLLITVGTTKFEALIASIDTPEFYATAVKHSFTKILIQKGSGSYIPSAYSSVSHALDVEVATILPNFETVIANSDLVISHGGAGIILECLKHKKKVIVCVNAALMDNHQIELASSLDESNYVKYCKDLKQIDKVLDSVLSGEVIIKEYPPFDYTAIPNVIYDMLQ